MKRMPSIKTLSAITSEVKTVRAWMKAYHDETLSLTKVMEWSNKLISGHGVEYIRHKEDTSREVYGITYVNMGDTYATTLLFVHAFGEFRVGSWGDIVEKYSDCYE